MKSLSKDRTPASARSCTALLMLFL
jgi:hypothetical protein